MALNSSTRAKRTERRLSVLFALVELFKAMSGAHRSRAPDIATGDMSSPSGAPLLAQVAETVPAQVAEEMLASASGRNRASASGRAAVTTTLSFLLVGHLPMLWGFSPHPERRICPCPATWPRPCPASLLCLFAPLPRCQSLRQPMLSSLFFFLIFMAFFAVPSCAPKGARLHESAGSSSNQAVAADAANAALCGAALAASAAAAWLLSRNAGAADASVPGHLEAATAAAAAKPSAVAQGTQPGKKGVRVGHVAHVQQELAAKKPATSKAAQEESSEDG